MYLFSGNTFLQKQKANYSPFHSSLPFEHLGQSNLFTRVCLLFVNQVVHWSLPFVCKSGNFLFYFRTETVSQVPGVLKIYLSIYLKVMMSSLLIKTL